MYISKLRYGLISLITVYATFVASFAVKNPNIEKDGSIKLPYPGEIEPRAAMIHLNPRPPPSTTTPTPTPVPQRPNPSEVDFPLRYALHGGWTIHVHAWSYIYPITLSGRYLDYFFTWIAAYAGARMLQNLAAPCGLVVEQGEMRFRMTMHPRSTVHNLTWELVAAFAAYMLRWVQNGFSGQGGLIFTHPYGNIMQEYMINNYIFVGEATAQVMPGTCPQPSHIP